MGNTKSRPNRVQLTNLSILSKDAGLTLSTKELTSFWKEVLKIAPHIASEDLHDSETWVRVACAAKRRQLEKGKNPSLLFLSTISAFRRTLTSYSSPPIVSDLSPLQQTIEEFYRLSRAIERLISASAQSQPQPSSTAASNIPIAAPNPQMAPPPESSVLPACLYIPGMCPLAPVIFLQTSGEYSQPQARYPNSLLPSSFGPPACSPAQVTPTAASSIPVAPTVARYWRPCREPTTATRHIIFSYRA